MKKLLKNKIVGLFLIGLFTIAPLFVKTAQAVSYPVPHIVTTTGTVANGEFFPLAQTSLVNNTTTEAHVQTYMTHAGTWSDFSVYIRAANATGDTTLTVRKNGVDTAMTVTIPQSTTGFFQDLTNTVSVSPADLMSIGVTTTAGSTTSLPSVTAVFESSSGDSVHYNMTLDPDGYSSSGQPRYFRIAGDLDGAPTVEARRQQLVQHAGNIVSIGAYVSANARTATTTFKTRINGGDGTLTFDVPTTSTGFFIDTSHSDAFVAGDLINGSYTWSSGTGNIIIRNIQYTLVSTNPREITFMGGSTISKNASTGSAWNFTAGLFLNSGANESVARAYPISPGVLSGMAYYASANTATQTLTYQIRKNTADGSQVVPIATGVTGWVQDVTNTDTFDNNDFTNVNGSRSVAGSGATSMQNTTALYTMDLIADGFLPQINIF